MTTEELKAAFTAALNEAGVKASPEEARLAREEKDAAVQYAKETAENTKELAAKLDELLRVKG